VIAEHIDIRAEIAKVQGELLSFRDRILPASFETPLDVVFQTKYADLVRAKTNGRLGEWQEATRRLADLLPLGPLASSTINREDFKEFLFQEATPSFCVRDGRIIWQITLYMDLETCFVGWGMCSRQPMEGPEALAEFLADLPAVRCWLTSLPVDSTALANSLCFVLPLVADADPAFAKLALDPETWRNLILADREITEEKREKRLQWIEGQVFSHWLNNSLLHVLGAIANNNFMTIEDFLDHPFLVGGYSHLTPSYLLAVLFEKVVILRQLSDERPELW
jgi:hypothetical protein